MKKFITLLPILLLAITVYLKQTAYFTYKGFGRACEPYKIELKEISAVGSTIIQGIALDGKIIVIPWDSIAWIEETK